MARSAIKAPASEGICSFCQSKIAKGQMTRHLKSCKERKSAIEKEAANSSKPAVKLFHILVEGQYAPEYWMHLELPASEELYTLDAFLRAIWLECCGHLSAFRIDGTSYDYEPEELMKMRVDLLASGERPHVSSPLVSVYRVMLFGLPRLAGAFPLLAVLLD